MMTSKSITFAAHVALIQRQDAVTESAARLIAWMEGPMGGERRSAAAGAAQ